MMKGIVFLLICACVQLAKQEFSVGCTLLGEFYKIGETRHLRLQDPQVNYCVACRCDLDSNGKSMRNCTSQMCPHDCPTTSVNDCCAICSGRARMRNSSSTLPAIFNYQSTSLSSFHQSDDAANPTLTPTYPVLTHQRRSCQTPAYLYKHGDLVHTKLASKPPCTQCICHNGQIQCSKKPCPALSCSNPTQTKQDCCPQCAESNEADTWSITFAKKGDEKNCASGDKYHVNGATWHPVIGPFGEMKCVLCKCVSGRTECSRLKCKKLECDNPVKETGHCCAVCAEGSRTVYRNISERSDLKSCLSSRSDLAVYKAESGGSTSRVVQYVFVELNSHKPEISIKHIQVLFMNDQMEKYQQVTLDRQNFEGIKTRFDFRLLGGTTKKQLGKFEKRMERRWKKCQRHKDKAAKNGLTKSTSHHCSIHLSQVCTTLKLRDAHMRDLCGAGEIQVHI